MANDILNTIHDSSVPKEKNFGNIGALNKQFNRCVKDNILYVILEA